MLQKLEVLAFMRTEQNFKTRLTQKFKIRSRLDVVCSSVQLLERTQSCPSVQALRAHSELSICAKLTGAHTL